MGARGYRLRAESDPRHIEPKRSTLWDERHVFVREGGATRYTFAMEVTGSTLPGATIQKQMVKTALQLKWALESPLLRAY